MIENKPHVVVIGAGPSGLIAAQHLAEAGCRVTVFDQKGAPARKFLMAGRGGLNLTHTTPAEIALAKYHGQGTKDDLQSALAAFTPEDLVAWAQALGEETFVGSSGRVFPKAMKASPLLRAWLRHLQSLGVELRLKQKWLGWADTGELLFASTDKNQDTQKNEYVTAQATILALGGASWPHLGSDGHWMPILQAVQVPLVPFAPANAGLCVSWSEHLKTKFSGQPLKNIAVSCGDHTKRGEVVITKRGLEGGACYALNAHVRDQLQQNSAAAITLNLKPDMTTAEIAERLKRPRGRQSLSNHLRKTVGLSPAAVALLHETANRNISSFDPDELAQHIANLPLTCTGLFDIDRAISSAGGIAFEALTSDFMLKAKPGLFAAGEMLDWDAPTGGYLLQASFATGIAAAKGAVRFLKGISNTPENAAKLNTL